MRLASVEPMSIIEEVDHLYDTLNNSTFVYKMIEKYNAFSTEIYLGQTCYKRTEKVMNWDEARRQCWLWGGELAFPLPDQHCTVVSYATETEEVIN